MRKTMKQKIIFIKLTLLVFLFFINCSKQDDWHVLKGPYLGEKPPGKTAKLFAPGVISTGLSERCANFTPDGKEFYFTVVGNNISFIAFMKLDGNTWTKPQIAPFSGRYMDGRFTIAPDGKKLYFTSNRSADGKDDNNNNNLWFVSKKKSGWTQPQKLILPDKINCNQFYPSVTNNGTLYFHSQSKKGKGNLDIFCSHLVEGEYKKQKGLGAVINSDNNEFDPFIDRDEKFIIFSRTGEGLGGSDLFVSFRKEHGSWTVGKNLGDKVNSSSWEIRPSITPDGKYLFFTSNRRIQKSYPETSMTYENKMKILNDELNSPGNVWTDIYWVDAKIIEDLKPKELK
jgi:Tol biopolymer transport system component